MSVHDVGHYRGKTLEAGVVLTVDPQLIIPEERKYVRVEDTVVITEDGIENFTDPAPLAHRRDKPRVVRGVPRRYPAARC